LYTDYSVNDENVNEYQQYDEIIQTIKKRFITYGYKRIKTSAFEDYDLYTHVNSSINQNEMIKVIDYTGEILVIRPDVTIPITRKLAQESTNFGTDIRYFYVQDVFRQPFDRLESIENTQAGIEYFGNRSVESDAEVIALACHTLTDLGFKDVKIEIGHAGFFKELIEQLDLNTHELTELKKIIQAKNAIEIRPFLERLGVDEAIANAIEKIPFLYGAPDDVAERANDLLITEKLKNKLNHLMKVYEMIKMYGLENNVIMDLGLINHMGYYSDIVFQGFVEKFGQPVLMGGRYDKLANEFGANIPAIGFACQVESLVQAITTKENITPVQTDFLLMYEPECMQEAIQLVNALREKQYSVVSNLQVGAVNHTLYRYIVSIEKDKNTVQQKDHVKDFSNVDDLTQLVEGGF